MRDQGDRKLDVVKAEVHKAKQELIAYRAYQERQCMCKYYEETLAKVKEENGRYVERIKANYQSDMEEYRMRYEDLKVRVALDINEKTLLHIKERHGQYYETFCQEKKVEIGDQVDSIELLFYICQRQQGDKAWLVDKLAETDEQKSQMYRENKQLNETLGRLREES